MAANPQSEIVLFECPRIATCRLTAESCARRRYGATVTLVPYLRDSPCARECPEGDANLRAHPVEEFSPTKSFRNVAPAARDRGGWDDGPEPERAPPAPCSCPAAFIARGAHFPSCPEYDLAAPPDLRPRADNRGEEAAEMTDHRKGARRTRRHYADRKCEECGTSFTPHGSTQKYCDEHLAKKGKRARAEAVDVPVTRKRKPSAELVVGADPRSRAESRSRAVEAAVALARREPEPAAGVVAAAVSTTRETLGTISGILEEDLSAVRRTLALLDRRLA